MSKSAFQAILPDTVLVLPPKKNRGTLGPAHLDSHCSIITFYLCDLSQGF